MPSIMSFVQGSISCVVISIIDKKSPSQTEQTGRDSSRSHFTSRSFAFDFIRLCRSLLQVVNTDPNKAPTSLSLSLSLSFCSTIIAMEGVFIIIYSLTLINANKIRATAKNKRLVASGFLDGAESHSHSTTAGTF